MSIKPSSTPSDIQLCFAEARRLNHLYIREKRKSPYPKASLSAVLQVEIPKVFEGLRDLAGRISVLSTTSDLRGLKAERMTRTLDKVQKASQTFFKSLMQQPEVAQTSLKDSSAIHDGLEPIILDLFTISEDAKIPTIWTPFAGTDLVIFPNHYEASSLPINGIRKDDFDALLDLYDQIEGGKTVFTLPKDDPEFKEKMLRDIATLLTRENSRELIKRLVKHDQECVVIRLEKTKDDKKDRNYMRGDLFYYEGRERVYLEDTNIFFTKRGNLNKIYFNESKRKYYYETTDGKLLPLVVDIQIAMDFDYIPNLSFIEVPKPGHFIDRFQSSSTVLAHELIHALHFLESPDKEFSREYPVDHPDKDYHTTEEKRTIEIGPLGISENTVRCAFGENSRKTHLGRDIKKGLSPLSQAERIIKLGNLYNFVHLLIFEGFNIYKEGYYQGEKMNFLNYAAACCPRDEIIELLFFFFDPTEDKLPEHIRKLINFYYPKGTVEKIEKQKKEHLTIEALTTIPPGNQKNFLELFFQKKRVLDFVDQVLRACLLKMNPVEIKQLLDHFFLHPLYTLKEKEIVLKKLVSAGLKIELDLHLYLDQMPILDTTYKDLIAVLNMYSNLGLSFKYEHLYEIVKVQIPLLVDKDQPLKKLEKNAIQFFHEKIDFSNLIQIISTADNYQLLALFLAHYPELKKQALEVFQALINNSLLDLSEKRFVFNKILESGVDLRANDRIWGAFMNVLIKYRAHVDDEQEYLEFLTEVHRKTNKEVKQKQQSELAVIGTQKSRIPRPPKSPPPKTGRRTVRK